MLFFIDHILTLIYAFSNRTFEIDNSSTNSYLFFSSLSVVVDRFLFCIV